VSVNPQERLDKERSRQYWLFIGLSSIAVNCFVLELATINRLTG
jgi:hypothetical protein